MQSTIEFLLANSHLLCIQAHHHSASHVNGELLRAQEIEYLCQSSRLILQGELRVEMSFYHAQLSDFQLELLIAHRTATITTWKYEKMIEVEHL